MSPGRGPNISGDLSPKPSIPNMVTCSELAAMVSPPVSRDTIRRQCEKGNIPFSRHGPNRVIFIKRADAENFLATYEKYNDLRKSKG